jgi:hypothetical protein
VFPQVPSNQNKFLKIFSTKLRPINPAVKIAREIQLLLLLPTKKNNTSSPKTII